jgi:Protein of unknown function (DUF3237)
VDVKPPVLTWLMTAEVAVGPRRSLGSWQSGERFMVDIVGGQVQGDGFTGRVLAGGADRQWLRPDDAKELQATYELELADGTVLSVHNQALLADGRQAARRTPCSARITAPTGRWDWLNRHLLVGDVTSLRPMIDAVEVRFFVLGR